MITLASLAGALATALLLGFVLGLSLRDARQAGALARERQRLIEQRRLTDVWAQRAGQLSARLAVAEATRLIPIVPGRPARPHAPHLVRGGDSTEALPAWYRR